MEKKRKSKSLVLSACVLIFAGLLFLAAAGSSGNQDIDEATDMAMFSRGMVSYHHYCQSCHGERGTGGEPVPNLLTVPADLTQLSAKNKGVFPEGRVTNIIKGSEGIEAHGTPKEPIWGEAFYLEDRGGAESYDPTTINEVVAFLKSIQTEDNPKGESVGTDEECSALVDWLAEGQDDDSEAEKTAVLNDPQAGIKIVNCAATAMGFQVEGVEERENEGFYGLIVGDFVEVKAGKFANAIAWGIKDPETKRGRIEARLVEHSGRVALLFNKAALAKYGTRLVPGRYRSLFGMWEILPNK